MSRSLRVLSVLGVLCVAPAVAASFKSPEGWVRRELSASGSPALHFILPSPEGDYRLEIYEYPRKNPFGMTEKKFLAELRARAGKEPVKRKSGTKDVPFFQGLPVRQSEWEKPHVDLDEGVLGASGGDFSVRRKLERCRELGAWKKYAWYRDVQEKKADAAIFAEHFSPEDERVVATCLGKDKLRDIKEKRKPDASVAEPDDKALDALAAGLEAAKKRPAREESLTTRAGKSGGFFVFRYESPAGSHDLHLESFLTLVGSFQE